MAEILILPEKTAIPLNGKTIMDSLLAAGIRIGNCGGSGKCGKCKIRILKGECSEACSEEKLLLSAEELLRGARLACFAKPLGGVAIEILAGSAHGKQKILTYGKENRTNLNPNVSIISKGGRRAVLIGGSKAETIKDAKSSGIYGMAFDVGTTTVVGYLLDLQTGAELAVSADTNPQALYGEDVISRINFAMKEKKGLSVLNEAILGCINRLAEDAANKAGIDRKRIYEMTLVGNTCMHHILLKLNPAKLAAAPYSPVLKGAIDIGRENFSAEISDRANFHFLPCIAGFVGSDTVAAALSSEIGKSEKTKLLIDLGTNGEIVLGSSKRLLACSTAAGPAFEGRHIKHGMRASSGAIERVKINGGGSVEIKTIDDAPPVGIAGSGLVDAVSEMLRTGILDRTGKIKAGSELVIAEKEKSGTGEKICVTQKDVRELQLAKAAVFAGIRILENELGISDSEISEIMIAGGFGNNIDCRSAMRIGLIPNVPAGKTVGIGNAAGAGAKMALISKEARENAKQIAEKIGYVELFTRKEFQKEFVGAMRFPEFSF